MKAINAVPLSPTFHVSLSFLGHSTGCIFEGQKYEHGEKVSEDSCSSCVCEEGR